MCAPWKSSKTDITSAFDCGPVNYLPVHPANLPCQQWGKCLQCEEHYRLSCLSHNTQEVELRGKWSTRPWLSSERINRGGMWKRSLFYFEKNVEIWPSFIKLYYYVVSYCKEWIIFLTKKKWIEFIKIIKRGRYKWS